MINKCFTSGGTGAVNFNLFKSKLLLRACFCGLKNDTNYTRQNLANIFDFQITSGEAAEEPLVFLMEQAVHCLLHHCCLMSMILFAVAGG